MFYKYEESQLLQGENIFGPGWELISEIKDTYAYPVDGWYWFDTEEEAKLFFNITDQ